MTKPKITETDISKLTPDPNNARKRTPLSASVIRKSIEQFGMTRSIVTDENGVILAGNGAFEEAGQLGIERVIVVETTGNEIVAVKRTNLTAEQKTQYAIADNTASDFSTWDYEILEELASEVDLSEFFPDDKLNELLEQLGKGESFGVGEQGEENEEEVAELLDKVDEIESRVKLGEIWQLGRHKLACGDSTIEGNVRALLGDRFGDVGMVFTDPPYNVAYTGKTKESLTIENDSFTSSSDFYAFLLKYYTLCCNAAKPGAAIYVCHADTEGENFRRGMREGGWLYKQSVVWVKQSLVLGRQDYHWKHEPILYGWKPGAAHNWYTDRSQTTVWEFDRPTSSREHPTMKPLNLIEYALGNSSAPDDIIYDGFLGSGSTLLAAEKMEGNRTVFGFELSPAYCEVILRRFESLTGEVARLVGYLPKQ